MPLRRSTLSIDLDLKDGPPTEFRIFRAGVNQTTKGPAVFNADAATAVMSKWKEIGNDLMIDLGHQSLDADDRSREDAGDARGWLKLEVRNGELWATNVTWTPDGARRLTEKTQRYISPAFLHDKNDQVVEMLNVALVAMPATHDAQALIAASRLSGNVSFEEIRAAVSAALDEHYPPEDGACDGGLYVVDLYDGRAIYERAGKLWAVSYAYEAGKATLAKEAEHVVRTYTPVRVAALARAARLLSVQKKRSRKPGVKE